MRLIAVRRLQDGVKIKVGQHEVIYDPLDEVLDQLRVGAFARGLLGQGQMSGQRTAMASPRLA